jgi:hypothetical protein
MTKSPVFAAQEIRRDAHRNDQPFGEEIIPMKKIHKNIKNGGFPCETEQQHRNETEKLRRGVRGLMPKRKAAVEHKAVGDRDSECQGVGHQIVQVKKTGPQIIAGKIDGGVQNPDAAKAKDLSEDGAGESEVFHLHGMSTNGALSL